MKLFKKVFVCVVAVCTMTTITNASNMDFISKDSVAYSATTFVDAGFNTGKVSTYKMNTLQE